MAAIHGEDPWKGRVLRSFLRFSLDTKQTRVLRYVNWKEKGSAFMVPDEGKRDTSRPNDPWKRHGRLPKVSSI